MYESIFTYIAAGLALGFSSGITPGPLTTLVISETVKHGRSAGMKVAVAPLITDAPIILVSFFLISTISGTEYLIGIITLTGGIFICYLGLKDLRIKGLLSEGTAERQDSMKRGIITNLLTPYPYIFWMSLGATIIRNGYAVSVLNPVFFIFTFYTLLVGIKLLIAYLAAKSRHYLESRFLLWGIKTASILLIIFGLLLVWEGIVTFYYL